MNIPLQSQLTAMAEREAEKYEPDDMDGIRGDFIAGHSSLHGIVLELVEAIELTEKYLAYGCVEGANREGGLSDVVDEALASIERKLRGE